MDDPFEGKASRVHTPRGQRTVKEQEDPGASTQNPGATARPAAAPGEDEK